MEETKKLFRSRKDKIIAGVCGGIAEYLSIDPVWIRLVAVLLTLTTGVGLIVYIVAWIIMPENPAQEDKGKTKVEAAAEKIGKKIEAKLDEREARLNAKASRMDAKDEKAADPKAQGDRRPHLLGGFLLVLIGLGFLMNNLFTWYKMVYTWSLAIIAVGIYILMRR